MNPAVLVIFTKKNSMEPLIVLLTAFGISALALKLIQGYCDFQLAGKIAMAAMLVFTALGHFMFTEGMSLMLPEIIPFKIELVYLTGVLEILFAVGLLIPLYAEITALMLIGFLVLMLPANIYAALMKLDFQKATYEGHGPNYLWFRVPLQAFFIGWVYWAVFM